MLISSEATYVHARGRMQVPIYHVTKGFCCQQEVPLGAGKRCSSMECYIKVSASMQVNNAKASQEVVRREKVLSRFQMCSRLEVYVSKHQELKPTSPSLLCCDFLKLAYNQIEDLVL